MEIGILTAFAGGIISFLSPCVLPLVPSYITFITGMTLEDLQQSRRETLLHKLLQSSRLVLNHLVALQLLVLIVLILLG